MPGGKAQVWAVKRRKLPSQKQQRYVGGGEKKGKVFTHNFVAANGKSTNPGRKKPKKKSHMLNGGGQ